MKSNHTTIDLNDFYADLLGIELGLDSAIAIFKECEIVVSSDHPDPGAIIDCKNNVYNGSDSLRKLRPLLEAAPELLNTLVCIRDLKGMALLEMSDDDFQRVLSAIAMATGERENAA